MGNPIYDAQLNRHEERIRDIDGRLHSYDLGLRWCEGQIKKLAGDDYSPVVVCTEDKESLEEHNDNQRKEINRLLKANEALKKEIQELKTRLGIVFAEKEKVRGDYERLRQDNLGLRPFEEAYDKLKNDYDRLKEAYKALDDRWNREKEKLSEKCYELQESIDLKNRRITTLSGVIDQKNSEIEKWKDAYLRSQVDVNNFQAAFSEDHEKVEKLEKENKYLRELYSCAVEDRKENKE